MELLAFIGTLGFTEILIILLIIVVLFGAKKIPELMRGLGTGIKEFKKASTIDEEDAKNEQKKIEP
jgi:sec-independent protein translocase protein TatA